MATPRQAFWIAHTLDGGIGTIVPVWQPKSSAPTAMTTCRPGVRSTARARRTVDQGLDDSAALPVHPRVDEHVVHLRCAGELGEADRHLRGPIRQQSLDH